MDFKTELVNIEKQNKSAELNKARLDQQLKTEIEGITKIESELKELAGDINKADSWVVDSEQKLTDVVNKAKEELG